MKLKFIKIILCLVIVFTVTAASFTSVLAAPELLWQGEKYDAYGFLVKSDSDTILHFFSRFPIAGSFEGMHVVKSKYTISTDTWSPVTTVYDYNSGRAGVFGGGIIGDKIMLFIVRYDNDMKLTDVGHIESSDLIGDLWGSYEITDVGIIYDTGCGGNFVETSIPGTYLQGLWVQTIEGGGAAGRQARVLKTNDYGESWAISANITNLGDGNENALAYIGNSRLIALVRDNDNNHRVTQYTSSDDGNTWSDLTLTNIGLPNTEGTRITDILYDAETNQIIVLNGYRTISLTSIIKSSGDADIVFHDATYENFETLDSEDYYFPTYPSIVKAASGQYYYVYSKGYPMVSYDVWGGYYVSTPPPPPPAPVPTPVPTPTPQVVDDDGGGGGGYDSKARGMPMMIKPTSDPDKFIVRMYIEGTGLLTRYMTRIEVAELSSDYTFTLEAFCEKYGMSHKSAQETADRYMLKPKDSEFSMLTDKEKANLKYIAGIDTQ